MLLQNIGQNALDELNKKNIDFTKVLKRLKSGESVNVKIISDNEVASYKMHSIYQVLNTTPCTDDCVVCSSVEYLREQIKLEQNEDKKKEMDNLAYNLSAKQRFLMGFVDLSTGEPIIMDLSKKQAQGLYNTIKKYEKKIHTMAFELSKTGEGTSTTLILSPIIDADDLSSSEQSNFEKAKDVKSIDAELYNAVIYKPSKESVVAQLLDLGISSELFDEDFSNNVPF